MKLSREEREKKILDNIKLVQYLAHRYKINGGNVLEIKDLIQEGILGLMEAIDTFDAKRGSFAPYASMLITQYMVRALMANVGVFSIGPVMYRLVCVCKNFVMLNSREPTNAEFKVIVKSVGVTYKNALTVYEGYSAVLAKKRCVSDSDNDSFDHTTCDIEAYNILDYISDMRGILQQEVVEKNELINKVIKLLKEECRRNERYVLVMYYGLGGKKRLSLKEIAEKMKVSVSNISNIKSAGEKRLRELVEKYKYSEDIEWFGCLPTGMKKIKTN